MRSSYPQVVYLNFLVVFSNLMGTVSGMSNRDAYAPGVPSWVTALHPDPEAGARFYAGVFGWELAPQDGGFVIGRVRGRDAAAVAPAPAGVSPGWITQIEAGSADETSERPRAAGGPALQEPVDLGGRFAVLADPTGWTFAIKEP